MVQWLGFCAFTAVGQGLIPGQGTTVPQAMLYCQKERKEGGRQERESRSNRKTESGRLVIVQVFAPYEVFRGIAK